MTNLIPTGKENAISMNDLAKMMNTDCRTIRLLVLKARTRENKLICSCDKGYYFPADMDELKEYIGRKTKGIKTSCIELAPFKRRMKGA